MYAVLYTQTGTSRLIRGMELGINRIFCKVDSLKRVVVPREFRKR